MRRRAAVPERAPTQDPQARPQPPQSRRTERRPKLAPLETHTRSASLRVRGALQLLSLQEITVNRRHRRALPAPRAKAPPRRRNGVSLGTKQARFRSGRAEPGAIAAPSAQPLCAQGLPPRPAPRAARQPAEITTANGATSPS